MYCTFSFPFYFDTDASFIIVHFVKFCSNTWCPEMYVLGSALYMYSRIPLCVYIT